MVKVKNQRGFTLIETVLALAITALLIAGAMTAQAGLRKETSFNTAIDQIHSQLVRVKNEAFSGVKVGTAGTGVSTKDVFGKLVEFDPGVDRTRMYVYTLIGDAEDPNARLDACDREEITLPNQLEYNGAKQAMIFTRESGSVFAAPATYDFTPTCSAPLFVTDPLNGGFLAPPPPPPLCPAPLTTPQGRDCQRIEDLVAIHDRLMAYAAANGNKLPTTAAYGGADPGGWDYSSQGGFLPFLTPPGVPTDPVNNGTGDVFFPALGGAGYSYAYYCYPAGMGWPSSRENKMALGAKLEQPADYAGDPRMNGSDVYWFEPPPFESGSFTCSTTMPSPPTVNLSPTAYEFPGAWHLFNTGGTKPTQPFTITNPGPSTVTLAATPGVISGPAASSYSIASENCPAPPATLAATASCTVTVRFFPPSGVANNRLINAGPKNATLTINDSGGAALKTASLSGWAVSDRMAPDDYLQLDSNNGENDRMALRAYNPSCYANAFSCSSKLALWNDGNMALYDNSGSNIWSTGPTAATYMVMQSNGNLVMFSPTPSSVWATSWQGAPLVSGAWLKLYDDGALRLLNPSWDSGGADSLLWAAPGW